MSENARKLTERPSFGYYDKPQPDGTVAWLDIVIPVLPVVRLGVLTDEAFYPDRVRSGRERLGE